MQTMADVPQKASLLQVVRMVLSAFLGIRKRADHEKIVVTPLQVIIVAVMPGRCLWEQWFLWCGW